MSARSDALSVWLAGQPIGRLSRGASRRLSFSYEPDWWQSADAYPLSLSLPLTAAEHGGRTLSAFLWGLLPESPLVLDRWARRFGVSASDPFALLAEVGEDCPGAVQFVRTEREALLERAHSSHVDWLSAAQLAERLRQLRADHAAWRSPTDTGQFSLAGAQPKTALLWDGQRFGIPSGRVPTTHILKPPLPELDGHAENEHLCLALARALGLPSAHSAVQHFGDEVAIVVERYDRVRAGKRLLRVHQEDMCQALGLLPSSKYQSEGGPSPEQLVELLRTHSSRPEEDVQTFLDALLFNWLIGGTDAHAKNYSLLIGAAGQVRLAPLYDVASAFVYPQLDPNKLKLAMKVGGSYRIREIERRHWQQLARDVHAGPTRLVERALALAEAIPEAFARLRDEARRQGLTHSVIDRLAVQLEAQARRCKSRLQ